VVQEKVDLADACQYLVDFSAVDVTEGRVGFESARIRPFTRVSILRSL